MKDKLLVAASWVTIFIASILMGIALYWSLYPYQIITFKTPTYIIRNTNKTIKAGDQLIYEAIYCKYTDIAPSVSRSFQDGLVYNMPTIYTNRNLGCNDLIVYVDVPKNLPPDTYKLHTLYVYQMNPLRRVMISRDTESFKVVK